jgi:hypothetical protein
MRLGRDERQELVSYLSGEGLSTRAIAPIVGVDRKTIERDIRGGTNVPPASGLPSSPVAMTPEHVAEITATEQPDDLDVSVNFGTGFSSCETWWKRQSVPTFGRFSGIRPGRRTSLTLWPTSRCGWGGTNGRSWSVTSVVRVCPPARSHPSSESAASKSDVTQMCHLSPSLRSLLIR